jgi:hypothetical protein
MQTMLSLLALFVQGVLDAVEELSQGQSLSLRHTQKVVFERLRVC